MSLKNKAKATAKRAGLLTGGLCAILIGVAFLTAAAWIYLSIVADTLVAALVIGGVYTGLGLILVGVASSSPAPEPDQMHDPDTARAAQGARDPAQPPLVQAFLYGMQAGVSANSRRP